MSIVTNQEIVFDKNGRNTTKCIFEESEFNPRLLPKHVHLIRMFTSKKTGKRYFAFVDTHGRDNIQEEIDWLVSDDLKPTNSHSTLLRRKEN